MADEAVLTPADVALKAFTEAAEAAEFVVVWRREDGVMSYGYADGDPAVVMGLLHWAAHEIMHDVVAEVEDE